ncbi:tRNA 2-selenouridine(34) synthase MnmH [Alicycliphilus denitrificans]|uniref:tRNA 2-selenouridine(34) synthase MnmH n=1 Tax=Alicycliphilus denitrificans TaxID=179636 RepID=A0A420KDY8_9BURK|nr:tRNA 2-selenouridine(34) synthase MnmH [Alicycliphilus denitrificans]RKJ97409.1 tRNA 2-selenouridine(34) synthase MnmH [Alicycliphilus denitrificans]
MSHHRPIRPADRHAFDAVIDARSPAEFAEDHIPGAINCPVLDDEERAIVGTLYVQQGAFEARRVGGAMVAANLARHLRERFADKPQGWRPLVYCWRGGMRSGSMVQWLRLVGWDAQQLAGGYKAFRRHVMDQIEALVPQADLRVLVGATGSAKTRVLQQLSQQGAQVLDLEHCARHKGSLLGALPGVAQPSQKNFETQIAAVLETLDLSRPLYVEGESARIGRLSVPVPLVQRLRAAACIEIEATPGERLSYLLRDYAYLGDDPEALARRLGALTELHGKETVQRWQAWARTGQLAPLFEELMRLHYDPHYGRSHARNFARWDTRQRISAPDLSPEGIAGAARAVLALG